MNIYVWASSVPVALHILQQSVEFNPHSALNKQLVVSSLNYRQRRDLSQPEFRLNSPDPGPSPALLTPSWKQGLNLTEHCGEHRMVLLWAGPLWTGQISLYSYQSKRCWAEGHQESCTGHWKPRRTKTLKSPRHWKTWQVATILKQTFFISKPASNLGSVEFHFLSHFVLHLALSSFQWMMLRNILTLS